MLPALSLSLLALVVVAIIIDLLIGDPDWLPHPVVLMGRVISSLERRLNRGTAITRRRRGFLLPLILVGVTYLLVLGLLSALYHLHLWLGLLAEVLLLASALAIKGLKDAALQVAEPLSRGDLVQARRSLACVVGRDTEQLDEAEITRGTVETLAENTVDGITAPLFWALIGGAPLALAYKAVNTLDSMVGHRNERFDDFGYASAKLDDLANWIPARLTALCLWCCGLLFPGCHTREAWHGTLRDAPMHPSPNAGWPEAMMAYLLGVQLGGTNYYQGVASVRNLMGEALGPLREVHIHRAIFLMHGAWMVFLLLMLITSGISLMQAQYG
ncbi:adenosylcobinamide-phosphate synthase CbiB [Nitrincola sp. MINF-07-Sa-05]|uniref:adenosylcobinamide-phosphate synthase CbiB n=1 Tax=Nitrincola salilacus TaxID=3400273 RepID=UPI003917F611